MIPKAIQKLTMIPKAIRWLLGVFAILGGVLACSAAQATRPPNIVFILTDDQGYRDLGCQGADGIQTPRIDRMAREGVRLTSFYAMATCSPTRAALLTGRYPARYRIHVPVNNPTGGLPPGETTLAEALKQQGYATGLIGKWHLGLSREMSPVAQGFDYFSGVPLSQIERGPHRTHDSYYRRQWRIQDAAGRDVVEYDPCEELFTQRCTQEAVEFIRRNHERPFFLYLAHPMPHGEIVASPKFAGKSPRGVYGDACQELDWSVGQILDELARLGLDQRTVVAYASDNGAQEKNVNREVPLLTKGSNTPLRGFKWSPWEGASRVPCIVRWPNRIPGGRTSDELVAIVDFFPTLLGFAGAAPVAGRVIDGLDLGPFLLGEADASPRRIHLYGGYGESGIDTLRVGRWKLVRERQLYDLGADISETRDLAAITPDIARQLTAYLVRASEAIKADVPLPPPPDIP